MRSTRRSLRGRSAQYVVNGASSDKTPFSHSLSTAYANTVLLTDPASKIVLSEIGALVSTLVTPYERRHASAESFTIAMDNPGTLVSANSSGMRLSRYSGIFGSRSGRESFCRAQPANGSRARAYAARQVSVTNLRRFTAIAGILTL